MLKMIIVWVLLAIFGLNSLWITLRTNFNFGTLLMWIVTAILLSYALFHKQISLFCKAGAGRVLKYIFIACALMFAGMFIFVAISGYTHTAKGNERAIIVLGAGLRGEDVSDLLRRRLVKAQELWQQNPSALIVVSGGQGEDEAISEALAMQRWLIASGVPQNSILLEDQSTSTEENLLFSKELLAAHGISANDEIAIVTNAFHCYRAKQYAKIAGFTQVRAAPASMSIITLLPSYMREVFATLYLWVFR